VKQSAIHLADVTLAVLAGGESSRMGRPKASLQIDGKPILAYLLERLNWPGATMLVTAPGRERPPGCEKFDYEVSDPTLSQGPLRGVLTALEYVKSPLLAVATVDMPGVGNTQLDWLVERVSSSQLRGAFCSRFSDGAWHIEPFPIVLRQEATGTVHECLFTEKSMRGLSGYSGVAVIPAPAWDPSVWTNLNTPADLETFLKRPV